MSCNSNIIDALPKTLHWLIRPGSSSFDFTFQVLESGAPIDISAYDFTVTIRRPNGTEVLSLGMGDGITLVSSTRGRATLSPGDSATLPQDIDLLWSFDMTTPTDEEYPMLGGRLVVTARTTACVQMPGDTDFTFTAAPAALDFSFSQSLPGTTLITYPICDNQTDARDNFNLETDDFFWYSIDTDEGIPYTLARVRPI